MTSTGPARRCGACRHFHNDPKYLERAFPGWNALGSPYGSTRAEDGICELHGIYLSAARCCEQFETSPPAASSAAP